MTFNLSATYNHYSPIVEKKNLLDYFPHAAVHYADYIKRESFRFRLVRMFTQTVEELQSNIFVARSLPHMMDDLGGDRIVKSMIEKVAKECWYVVPSEKFEKEFLAQSTQYRNKAIKDTIGLVPMDLTQKGIGKMVDKIDPAKAKNKYTKILGEQTKNAKATWGKWENKWDKTKDKIYTNGAKSISDGVQSKVKTGLEKIHVNSETAEKFSNKLGELTHQGLMFDGKRTYTGTDLEMFSFKTQDVIEDKINDALPVDFLDKMLPSEDSGIDVSLNNNVTRDFLTSKLHFNEWWANATMGTADFIADIAKVSRITKGVESAAVNAYMAWFLNSELKKQHEQRQGVIEMNQKLSHAVVEDFSTMSAEDLYGLMTILDIKNRETLFDTKH